MNRLVKAAGALTVAGAVAAIGISPAMARPAHVWHRHHSVHHHYYRPAPRPYPYYYNYGYGYGYYPYYYDPGAAIVGGFVGSVFGAIAHDIRHHR